MCDFIETQHVGGGLFPVHCTIVRTKGSTDIQRHIFATPVYLPVIQRRIDTIHVSLVSESDELVIPSVVPTSLVLHFRVKFPCDEDE